ncbi:MAG: hypothetical protein IPN76_09640 [Saprospiraceae bacterium]|nr:hypothetical protein [Saprospiraceae bacterium]
MPFRHLLLSLACFIVFSCKNETTPAPSKATSQRPDPHSLADPFNDKMLELQLKLKVDFDKKILSGSASWSFDRKEKTNEIIFDTDNLTNRKSDPWERRNPNHLYARTP